jgi:hypothetical protein
MTNSEMPSNVEELKQILNNATNEELSNNLSELIKSYKESNIIKNKKLLKLIFEYVLDNSINKLNPSEVYDYLNIMALNFLELCHLFQNEFNEFVKKFLLELETYILNKNFEEEATKENQLINFSLLISFLTFKLDQPNQLFSNFITLLNIHLTKLQADVKEKFMNFGKKIFFVGILEILSQNVNSFNPFLFNQIEIVLNKISEYLKNNTHPHSISIVENFEIKNFRLLSIEKIFTTNKNSISDFSVDEKYKIISILYFKLTQIILSLVESYKENLTFEVLFRRIFDFVKEIEKHFETQKEILDNSIAIRNKIEEYKFKILEKKNIQFNFMIIKRKPLVSLEPEYDKSFLGSLGDYKPNDEKMMKIMKKKIKSTKKQAVRNLKKEAKVIDVARQKKNYTIYAKRKEELKISNQFYEQQKIEDKKLMTSQSKKRFKIKNKRGKI